MVEVVNGELVFPIETREALIRRISIIRQIWKQNKSREEMAKDWLELMDYAKELEDGRMCLMHILEKFREYQEERM